MVVAGDGDGDGGGMALQRKLFVGEDHGVVVLLTRVIVCALVANHLGRGGDVCHTSMMTFAAMV